MLGRHEPEIAHQLAGSAEAADVADLGDQPDGAHRVDAAQGAQRCNHGLEAPALHCLGQRGRQPLHALLGRLNGELVFGQRDAVGVVVESLVAIQRSWLLVQDVLPG